MLHDARKTLPIKRDARRLSPTISPPWPGAWDPTFGRGGQGVGSRGTRCSSWLDRLHLIADCRHLRTIGTASRYCVIYSETWISFRVPSSLIRGQPQWEGASIFSYAYDSFHCTNEPESTRNCLSALRVAFPDADTWSRYLSTGTPACI